MRERKRKRKRETWDTQCVRTCLLDSLWQSVDPGMDASTPTLAILSFSKKVTYRRERFEELAHSNSNPSGVVVLAHERVGLMSSLDPSATGGLANDAAM